MNSLLGRPGPAHVRPATRNPIRLGIATACVLGLTVAASARAAVVDAALVARLAEVARTNHPGLQALARRADAADLDAEAVRMWADPAFQVGGEVSREGEAMARSRGDLIYGLQQRLPVLGKERSARQAARAAAATAATRADSRFREVRRDLAISLLEAAVSEESAGLDREDLAWLALARSTIAARVASGTAPAAELLRVENELARRTADLTNSLAVLSMRRATVNRMLGLPAAGDVLEPLELPDIAPAVPASPAVVDLALDAEPGLRVLRRERDQAGRVVELTRRLQRPDLAIGVQGRQFSGDAGFREGMFTLSLNLPWMNRTRYRRDIARDEARLEAAGLEQADRELEVREEVHHLAALAATAERGARLVRDDLLPRTRALAAGLEARWMSGQADVGEVLDARREAVALRRMLARNVADGWIALGELQFACGLDGPEALLAASRDPLALNPDPRP